METETFDALVQVAMILLNENVDANIVRSAVESTMNTIKVDRWHRTATLASKMEMLASHRELCRDMAGRIDAMESAIRNADRRDHAG